MTTATHGAASTQDDVFEYNDVVVKQFLWATLIWGTVGLLVGVIIAVQLFYPPANFNLPWLTFGRLRPLHTNAVIFAFCGNAIFAGMYHSSQRLLKTRMWSDVLSRIHMWGWQLIIVSAALTLPFGFTQSKEYAELEWPIDIAIAAVWVTFAVNFFMTLKARRERVLYVSIWFYIATIVTIAMLHIVNSLALPYAPLHSYSLFSGIHDATIQWWYGHNAVAFFLTTPFLGMAYYYIPKATQKPIYSYRLSIIHFWSLIFIYIWAGPHHLLYTSIPEWLQSLGMVFSVMLLAPSWGGGLNFILTLRMAWDKVKSDPILKFLGTGVTFYMMSTFEGPLLSIKSVNMLSHYTDWTIAHVHSGTLGWNGMTIFGVLYWLLPRMYQTKIYNQKWVSVHFWTATLGILLYIIPMWISGITAGIMTSKLDASGALLYPNFTEIVTTLLPLHHLRALGGILYLSGIVLMFVNMFLTVRHAPAPQKQLVRAPALAPVTHAVVGIQQKSEHWASIMTVLATIAVATGGLFQLVPLLSFDTKSIALDSVKPYSPLELLGRDIYIREGCNNCHSQQVRPLIHEFRRYGEASHAGEFVYDHPHLWGSKRTGPDLHRVGKKYGDVWHWKHMVDPRVMSPGSVMPNYPWLATAPLDYDSLWGKITTMRLLGVPYTAEDANEAAQKAQAQAQTIASGLTGQGIQMGGPVQPELIGLIAYLQRLGTDFKPSQPGTPK